MASGGHTLCTARSCMLSAALCCITVGDVNAVMPQHATDTESCDAFRYSFGQSSIDNSGGEGRPQAVDTFADISKLFAASTNGYLEATGQPWSAGPELVRARRDRINHRAEQ